MIRLTDDLTYGGHGATQIHQFYPTGSAPAKINMMTEEFIDKLATAPLLYEPVTVWDYGFGLVVLGIIEEKIAGKSFGAVLQERVLGPQTVAFMTDNHLNKNIKNNVSGTEPARVGYGYGFGLGVAVRTERGLSVNNGNVGDY